MFDREGNRKYLNHHERKAFHRIAVKEIGLFEKALLLCLFFTGCRISEALCVLPERVDLVGGTITFETLKRRKRGCFRAVPIPDELIVIFRLLLKGQSEGTRLWKFSRPTAYRLVKAKMAKARIMGTMACPKGLRHGFGVACVAAGVPVTIIRKWFGHSRLETTAIYLEVMGQEERALAKRLWKLSA